jgi:hypothetical protein
MTDLQLATEVEAIFQALLANDTTSANEANIALSVFLTRSDAGPILIHAASLSPHLEIQRSAIHMLFRAIHYSDPPTPPEIRTASLHALLDFFPQVRDLDLLIATWAATAYLCRYDTDHFAHVQNRLFVLTADPALYLHSAVMCGTLIHHQSDFQFHADLFGVANVLIESFADQFPLFADHRDMALFLATKILRLIRLCGTQPGATIRLDSIGWFFHYLLELDLSATDAYLHRYWLEILNISASICPGQQRELSEAVTAGFRRFAESPKKVNILSAFSRRWPEIHRQHFYSSGMFRSLLGAEAQLLLETVCQDPDSIDAPSYQILTRLQQVAAEPAAFLFLEEFLRPFVEGAVEGFYGQIVALFYLSEAVRILPNACRENMESIIGFVEQCAQNGPHFGPAVFGFIVSLAVSECADFLEPFIGFLFGCTEQRDNPQIAVGALRTLDAIADHLDNDTLLLFLEPEAHAYFMDLDPISLCGILQYISEINIHIPIARLRELLDELLVMATPSDSAPDVLLFRTVLRTISGIVTRCEHFLQPVLEFIAPVSQNLLSLAGTEDASGYIGGVISLLSGLSAAFGSEVLLNFAPSLFQRRFSEGAKFLPDLHPDFVNAIEDVESAATQLYGIWMTYKSIGTGLESPLFGIAARLPIDLLYGVLTS